MKKRIFGEIKGIFEGDSFDNRIDLSISKVHRPTQAGISGSENEGSDSIVISGGYEDDEDLGNIIIYTGHGGRSNNSKVQVADQTLTRGNKALAISCEKGLPVRVIRGYNKQSKFSPEEGYRYDGLFLVKDYWRDKGKSGYVIWRFRLEKISNKINLLDEVKRNTVSEPVSNYGSTVRQKYFVSRVIRETRIAQYIKELYNDACQVCGIQIKSQVTSYSEAAHIKALGKPHNGPDTKENILCLCPNHHTMFDLGIISIDDNFNILGIDGVILKVHPKHIIDKEFVKYHREHHYKKLS
ncbi:putative restriction endonuclease [Tenacibaculum lutimaris]|uniref:Putative restriction endonuclease n=1 Tax=Tenacibaculum lutimaris TaxID=285258 RepID=A0A420E4P5_9FLAO|nr:MULTISPECIES: YDG/SRA domain-containing protein [Tenacibaculum]RKF05105.1 putative restriction endonuclease [Tenacibaculum lutimaris]